MSEALGEVEAAVGAVLVSPLWSLSDADVVDQTRRVFVVMQRLSARFAALVGEAGSRGLARQAGAATPTAWLAGSLAMPGSQAHRWVKLAGLLRETPSVAEALAAGEVSVEQARVIGQTIHDLPAEVGAASRQHAVDVLTKLAVQERLRPEVLARHREEILDEVAPEIAQERLRRAVERGERSAHERRSLTLSPWGEGGYRLRAILTSEAAAIVRAALEPLCAPSYRPAPTDADTAGSGPAGLGTANPGPAGSGTAGSGPAGFSPAGSGTAGFSPAGSGTAGFATADGDRRDPRTAGFATAHPGTAGFATAGGGTADPGTAGSATASDGTADPGTADGDRRSAGARRADALVEICRRVLDTGELPESGGQKPHVVVTMSWEQLRDQVGAGLLDTGDLLTPQTVRRLACDAQIIPAVLGGDGQVLDVGRARRLIDGPLRRALVMRDKGCAWPGCDRPSRWCHGHHVQPWQDGGPTSLNNSVLLCGFHHRQIHQGWWQVRIAPDGHPEFIPPAYIDPARNPVRNTLHRRC